MCIRYCENCLKWVAFLLIGGTLFVGGVQFWLREKSYVFDANDVAAITKSVLSTQQGFASWKKEEDHKAIFEAVEKRLREKYGAHILAPSRTEWLFINAGGWMGSFYLLHASLTEYVLFFGTAIDTSGHSGRYWANISDTIITGSFRQWKEGTTNAVMHSPGDTVYHNIGETTAVQWTGGTWMVEYGRGFVPSTLTFALADTVFGTTDFYLMYQTFKLYSVAVFHELLMGNA